MEAGSVIQMSVGVTVVLGQFILLVFFFAKIYSQTNTNTERVKELRTLVDDHIKNAKIHQDQAFQSFQFKTLEEKITKLENQIDHANASIDEIKGLLMERST